MKIRWKKVFYFVFLLGSILGFKNADGQNDSIQNKNIESNFSEKSFQISGVVRDSSNNNPVPFCNVILSDKNDKQIAGSITDIDGKYMFKNISKGNYKLSASFIGYKPNSIELELMSNFQIEILLSPSIIESDSIIILCYHRVPMIDKYNTTSGETIKSDDIKNMPIRR